MAVLLIVVALALCWALTALILDAYGRRPLAEGTYDAIVVPGCAVRQDGTASGALQRRTAHAIDLWHAGVAPKIVLTGGVGRYPKAEARVAADLVLAAGVPSQAVLLESESTTTEANARLAASLCDEMARWHIVVTTDGYHCWRCRQLFGRYFARVETAGSTPGTRLRVRGALREVASILKMWARKH